MSETETMPGGTVDEFQVLFAGYVPPEVPWEARHRRHRRLDSRLPARRRPQDRRRPRVRPESRSHP